MTHSVQTNNTMEKSQSHTSVLNNDDNSISSFTEKGHIDQEDDNDNSISSSTEKNHINHEEDNDNSIASFTEKDRINNDSRYLMSSSIHGVFPIRLVCPRTGSKIPYQSNFGYIWTDILSVGTLYSHRRSIE